MISKDKILEGIPPIPAPADLVWKWCWAPCNGAYTSCPKCDMNSCACGCMHFQPCPMGAWWETVTEAEKQGLAPQMPTREETIDRLKYVNGYLTGESISDFESDVILNPHILQINVENVAEFAVYYGLEYPTWGEVQKALKKQYTPEYYELRKKRILDRRKWRSENWAKVMKWAKDSRKDVQPEIREMILKQMIKDGN